MPTVSPVERGYVRKRLESPDTFGSSMLAILVDTCGVEAFEWDVESIVAELEDQFSAKIPTMNIDKLMSLIVAMTTNQFQLSWEVFAETCRALSGEETSFDELSLLDPEDVAWGAVEVALNDPPDPANGTAEFSHEVRIFAGVVLSQSSIYQLPSFLSWVEFPKDPALQLENALGDDPDMFAAAQKMQMENAEYLESYVKDRMNALKQELQSLPLTMRQRTTDAPA